MNTSFRHRTHGPRHRLATDPVSRSPVEAWSYLAALWSRRPQTAVTPPGGGWIRMPITYQTSIEALKQPLADVLAELAEPAPPAALSVVKEHIRARIALDHEPPPAEITGRGDWEVARALVELWTGTHGLRFALDVLLGPPQFERTVLSNDDDKVIVELAPPQGDHYSFRLDTGRVDEIDPFWWALREWVSQRSDTDFAADRVVALAALAAHPKADRSSHNARCRIAFAFARDPSIANEVVAPLLATGYPPDDDNDDGPNPTDAVLYLFPSLPSARDVLALMDKLFQPAYMPALGHLTFDVLEAYGPESAPIFERILASPGRAKKYMKNERTALAQAQAGAKSKSSAAPAKKPKKPAARTATNKPTRPVAKKPAAKKPARRA